MQQKHKPYFHKECDEKLLFTNKSCKPTAISAMAVYLFNPYTISACLAKSTAVFDNMLLAVVIIFTLKGMNEPVTKFLLKCENWFNYC